MSSTLVRFSFTRRSLLRTAVPAPPRRRRKAPVNRKVKWRSCLPALVCPADLPHHPQLELIRGTLWKTSAQPVTLFRPALAQHLSGVPTALQIRSYKIHTSIGDMIQSRIFYTFLWANKTVHPVTQQGINIVRFQMERNPACGDSGPLNQ